MQTRQCLKGLQFSTSLKKSRKEKLAEKTSPLSGDPQGVWDLLAEVAFGGWCDEFIDLLTLYHGTRLGIFFFLAVNVVEAFCGRFRGLLRHPTHRLF